MNAGQKHTGRGDRRGSSAGAVGAVAVASLLLLSVGATAAAADPLTMTFTEARANVGVQLSDAALFEAPETAPLEAQIGPGGEAITEGELQVPEFSTHISAPIDADVTVEFDIGVITGTFIDSTGALTLSGTAGGTLKANGKECIVSTAPEPLVLSTAGNSGGPSPRSGAAFAHGLGGAGAIAGQWTDMQAAPVDPEPGGDKVFCEDVEDQIGGPGGIWMVQEGDVTPPPAPQLTGTDPASPSSSREPRILGSAEAGSTVRIHSGSGCTGALIATGSAAELASPGIAVAVDFAEYPATGIDGGGPSATFSATATDAAGNTSDCSTPISYTGLHIDPPQPPPPACIVPKLRGRTLVRARAALRAADCRLGKVRKPKRRKGRRRGPLVVRSSKPGAGAVLPAGSKVDLRLGSRSRRGHAHRQTR